LKKRLNKLYSKMVYFETTTRKTTAVDTVIASIANPKEESQRLRDN